MICEKCNEELIFKIVNHLIEGQCSKCGDEWVSLYSEEITLFNMSISEREGENREFIERKVKLMEILHQLNIKYY